MAMEMTSVGRVNFAANVSGPWTCRTREDFLRELDRLAERLRLMLDAGLKEEVENLTRGQKFTIGVKDAAAWTLGKTQKAPFGPELVVVSDASVGALVTEAFQITRMETIARDYAFGVLVWLLWLFGEGSPTINYPRH